MLKLLGSGMRTNVFGHACCVHLHGPLPPWRWRRPISPEISV